MTDKQWRWTLSPAEHVYSEKLLLPSFGIYVSRSDPSAVAFLKEGRATDFLIDSGDAYSVSYLRESSNVSTADQDFADLDPGYLRRILLRILDGEEYERLEEHHTRRTLQGLDPAFLEGRRPRSSEEGIARGSSGVAQVRLTDLRLATDITSADLRRELRLVLPGLPLPLTTEGVAKWKWKTGCGEVIPRPYKS